jgi:hypothetical protein
VRVAEDQTGNPKYMRFFEKFPYCLKLYETSKSHRRGCHRVLQFCVGSKVTKILGFQPEKIFGDPPYPSDYAIFGRKRGAF